jgi:hypothetical protein
MLRSSVGISIVAGSLLQGLCMMPACGAGANATGFGGSSSSGGGVGSSGDGSGGALEPDGGFTFVGSSGGGTSSVGGVVCPSGWQCNVPCSPGTGTQITGTVMDPAGANPLYNVVAYVPTTALGTLPSGVPTGTDACSCSALFQGNPIAYATTSTNGTFKITNAPVGQNIPLVIQIGKWRKQVAVNTTSCATTNAGTINLPKNSSEGSLPDIAVSTGAADSLECLLVRVGIDPAEYVPGWTRPGHVHIYNGGSPTILGVPFPGIGREANPMAGAPVSSVGLWGSTADLMKNDLILLSCEAAEPANAIPQNLEDYLNAGGRAFASHFHYAWFNGSAAGGYNAPADWGGNLAQWSPGIGGGTATGDVGGEIVTTLTTNGGGTFAKGVALDAWLTGVHALGTSNVPAADLAIAEPRYNANVTTQKPSQPWVQLDPATDTSSAPTMFFSFDTPVSTAENARYCGRAVFSSLHVGGASYDGVNCNAGGGGIGGLPGEDCNPGHVPAAPPPAGCDTSHPLSPQEKVLEFMLFDLSSCVVPDTEEDAGPGTIIIPK